MLYLYDRAICDDIRDSINSANAEPNVFIADEEVINGLIAQVKQDTITYPVIMVSRDEDMPIIPELCNFTRMKYGVPAAFDNKTNNLYFEKAIPVDLQYTITILSTNTADTDELARELFYKYLSQYYLTIQLPYESDRKVRFALEVDLGHGIRKESNTFDYLKTGSIYKSTIHLKTNGCVALSYRSMHLRREVYSSDIGIVPPNEPTKE